MKLEDHFNDNALEFFELQTGFSKVAGDLAWQLRAEDSELDFGTKRLGVLFKKRITYSAALLGTESLKTNTFRWPWASEHASKPFGRLGAKLRKLGLDEFGCDQLQVGGFGDPEGMDLASMAAASLGIPMYRCPHRRGAVYVGLLDVPEPPRARSAAEVAAVIDEAVRALVIMDQKRAVQAYCKSRGLSVEQEPATLLIQVHDETIEASFDEGGWLQKTQVRS